MMFENYKRFINGIWEKYWVPITLGIFTDGVFHAYGTPELIMRAAPDWILANSVGRKILLTEAFGLPVSFHRFLGFSLIAFSIYALYAMSRGSNTGILRFYKYLIVPVTLFVIGLAIVIKLTGG